MTSLGKEGALVLLLNHVSIGETSHLQALASMTMSYTQWLVERLEIRIAFVCLNS